VAIFVIGTDPHDLTSLAALSAFRPKATAIVRNEAIGPRADFARVMRHPAYQAAVKGGAIPLWMPKLATSVARVIDARNLAFEQAGADLGPLVGAPVRGWLRSMEREFSPISSWLP
jgi:hypothetical protein